MKIKFKKLHPNAGDPLQGRKGDAGWDLTAVAVSANIVNVHNFHTGIAVEIPPGYFGLLRPRSSIRNTAYVMASSGVIDSGYRGEIVIPLRKVEGDGLRADSYIGQRICQLIILPLPEVEFEEATELSESERGAGGFGSTGTK